MLARAVGSCRRRRVPGAVARIGRTCGGTSSCLSRRLVRRLLRLVRPLLRLVRRPLRLVRRLLRLVRRRATRRRPLSRSSGRREWLRGRRRPATRRPLRHDEPASSARRRPGRVVQRTTWTPHRIPNLGVLESLSLRAYRRPGHPASPRCGAAGDPSLGASLVRGPRVLWSRAVRPVGRRPSRCISDDRGERKWDRGGRGRTRLRQHAGPGPGDVRGAAGSDDWFRRREYALHRPIRSEADWFADIGGIRIIDQHQADSERVVVFGAGRPEAAQEVLREALGRGPGHELRRRTPTLAEIFREAVA